MSSCTYQTQVTSGGCPVPQREISLLSLHSRRIGGSFLGRKSLIKTKTKHRGWWWSLTQCEKENTDGSKKNIESNRFSVFVRRRIFISSDMSPFIFLLISFYYFVLTIFFFRVLVLGGAIHLFMALLVVFDGRYSD